MGKKDLLNISIEEFRAGGMATFSNVYRAMYPAILVYSRKIVLDDAEAQDIASISFQQLWNKRSEMQSIDNIKNFLYRVAKNRCLDYLKSISRKSNSHKEILYLSKESEPATDYNLIGTEVFNEIRLEIKKLPVHWASVFELMFYEGKNTKEVAEKLGITKQTALNYKSKAVANIKFGLQKKNLISPALLLMFLALY